MSASSKDIAVVRRVLRAPVQPCGRSSMVERRVVVPMMGVRFSPVTPKPSSQVARRWFASPEIVGSTPTSASRGGIAQW